MLSRIMRIGADAAEIASLIKLSGGGGGKIGAA